MSCSLWYTLAGTQMAWAYIDFRYHAWGWFAFAVAGAIIMFCLGHFDEEKSLDNARSHGKVEGILESTNRYLEVRDQNRAKRTPWQPPT